jgi:hypothetical protein
MNCLLKHVIEGKLEEEVTGIQGRRCNQVLDKFKGKREYSKLKEEEPDRKVWRIRFFKSSWTCKTDYGTNEPCTKAKMTISLLIY